MHTAHEHVAAGSIHGSEILRGIGVEHVDLVAIFVLAPHAVTGAELHLTVERTGLLNRVVEHRPTGRVGQVSTGGIRYGQPSGVCLTHAGTGEHEVQLAVAQGHVRTFGYGGVPRILRGDDAHRGTGHMGRVLRIHRGDVGGAELLPGVVGPAVGILEIGHVERHAHSAGRCGCELLVTVEQRGVIAVDRCRHSPVIGVGRVEVVTVGILLELHVHRLAVGPCVAVSGHEQNREPTINLMNFWSPEAVHDGITLGVLVASLEQRHLLVVVAVRLNQGIRVARLVGETGNRVGHAERHVGRTMLPSDVTLDVIGSDHQELGFGDFLAVGLMRPLPLIHRWIGAVLSERNLVFGLLDGAGDSVITHLRQIYALSVP